MAWADRGVAPSEDEPAPPPWPVVPGSTTNAARMWVTPSVLQAMSGTTTTAGSTTNLVVRSDGGVP